jgi:hypothetical protein
MPLTKFDTIFCRPNPTPTPHQDRSDHRGAVDRPQYGRHRPDRIRRLQRGRPSASPKETRPEIEWFLGKGEGKRFSWRRQTIFHAGRSISMRRYSRDVAVAQPLAPPPLPDGAARLPAGLSLSGGFLGCLRAWTSLGKTTVYSWLDDRVPTMGAAIAFYTSIFACTDACDR